jgi:exodeoxyribonuclease VII large subunit
MIPFDPEEIIGISQLTGYLRQTLEQQCPLLYIRGEISNLSRPCSGHWYFSLKDEKAQIRCVLFRQHLSRNAPHLAAHLKDGCTVIVQASLTVYEERGDMQLLVQQIALSGEGYWQQQYEALKAKLTQEGLFNNVKYPLPSLPEKIGIISSPTGAALQDVLSVLKRRYPIAELLLFPSLVQGEEAPAQLCNALEHAYADTSLDVLLLVRGGGSIEDLWAFNTESVVRMVAQSPLPLISGVGHEVDHTLVDEAASQRAPTPSAAAEMATIDQAVLRARLQNCPRLLARALDTLLKRLWQQHDFLSKRLIHPKERLKQAKEQLSLLHQRLQNSVQQLCKQYRQQQALLYQKCLLLSPLHTLKRGYCIARDQQQHIVSTRQAAQKASALVLQFQDGIYPFIDTQSEEK